MKPAQTQLLPPLYYLDNFLSLLSSVEHQYGNLLTPDELDVLKNFKSLARPEQALLVRLYSRRGVLFRSDKLNYKELPGLENLVSALKEAGFIQFNPTLNSSELLSLATCRELRQWWQDKFTLRPQVKNKAALVATLSNLEAEAYYATVPYTIISIEHQRLCELLLLLFFGHPDQDLSAFITAKLGYVQYEQYSLSPKDRLFRNRRDVEHAVQLMQIRTTFHQLDSCSADIGLDLLRQLPLIADDSPLKARHDRLCNRIGRALEKCQAPALALLCYQRSSQPPSRERQARIQYKEKNYTKATALCDIILARPWSEAEAQFARRFKLSCLKRAGQKVKPAERFQPNTEILALTKRNNPADQHCRVESLASRSITEATGGICYYVENWLFNAAFGLTFWQAIFSAVRGAFTHPFQSGPRDLYELTFAEKRQAHVRRAFELIGSRQWQAELQQRWQQKYGISNPFIAWHASGWPMLALALKRIPVQHWRAIFQRMLHDLRENCSGFPDLIHFPESSGYRLLEVKSPTDKLQANQLRWMQAFEAQQIPYALLQIQWSKVASSHSYSSHSHSSQVQWSSA